MVKSGITTLWLISLNVILKINSLKETEIAVEIRVYQLLQEKPIKVIKHRKVLADLGGTRAVVINEKPVSVPLTTKTIQTYEKGAPLVLRRAPKDRLGLRLVPLDLRLVQALALEAAHEADPAPEAVPQEVQAQKGKEGKNVRIGCGLENVRVGRNVSTIIERFVISMAKVRVVLVPRASFFTLTESMPMRV